MPTSTALSKWVRSGGLPAGPVPAPSSPTGSSPRRPPQRCPRNVPVMDAEGNPFKGRIGRGSKVRIMYAEGQPHPVHGTSTYLNKIKVLEVAEQEGGEDF